MPTVISVEHLSKTYRLGQISTGTFTNDLKLWWAKMRGKPNPLLRIGEKDIGNRNGEELWALKDVSFTVEQGEVLGIIGRNGAGKSTLLKILSRVTAPTSGRIRVKGRVASLLEVGTGFHPELTGRENIYLNGAILGMSRLEIDHKFDEIVDFAEVEKFIDTPVKRYSSGMYVRLAFAVAAHLDPEILLVDEVLAVGDAEFQKKCLGKMGDISQTGRTVFFVSHNMSSILRLSKRVLLISKGTIENLGQPEKVVDSYFKIGTDSLSHREWINNQDAPGNDMIRIRSVRVINEHMQTIETVDIRKKTGIEIIFEQIQLGEPIVPTISLYNKEGQHVLIAIDTNNFWENPCEIGFHTCTAWIPGNLLNEGRLSVSIALNTHSSGAAIRQAVVRDVVVFQVLDPLVGDSAKGRFTGKWGGAVTPLLEWSRNYQAPITTSGK
ncbi:MAG: ATP-binding cassette domain-containing protein [Saprospiraceae bacterium]|nr:MAG: ATP-binding cassette domain-containing protein [Saprospiraceae bacterium]